MKVCKIRIYPNKSQIKLINETLGCCRYIKNLYIEYNQKIYEEEKRFLSGYDFSKIINKLKKSSEKYRWVNQYSSKAIKDAIMEEEKAFKRFFKRYSGFPKFKSRKRLTHESFFFIKDNIYLTDNKYILKLPILGKIRITEYDYLPDISTISSGRIIKDRNKYYVSFIYQNHIPPTIDHTKHVLGIDIGIKNYISMYSSSGIRFQESSFINYPNYKSLKRKIESFQKIISKKAEINYWKLMHDYLSKHNEEPTEHTKNIMKGESYNSSNIRRIWRKINKLYEKLKNIRADYINKLVYRIITRTKCNTITIEDLNITEMIKNIPDQDNNHTLHKYISESGFYMFREKLIRKCIEYGTHLRVADKYFASSKICSCCGKKKKELMLSDRIFKCEKCGFEEDRDMNAAINLCRLKKKYYTCLI